MLTEKAETRTTIGGLAAKEIELLVRQQQISSELAASEITAGDDFLDGRETSTGVENLVRLELALRALNRGVAALRAQRAAVIREEFLAQAKQVRQQVAAKTSQLATLTGKTGKALAELSRLEDVPYDARILKAQASGDFGFYAPLSERIRAEISKLESEAAELETKDIPARGFIDLESVTSRQEIVLAALESKTTGPSAQVVETWLNAVDAAILKRTGKVLADEPRRCRLEWNESVIDLSQSYIFAAVLAKPLKSRLFGTETVDQFDIASGAFHAVEQRTGERRFAA